MYEDFLLFQINDAAFPIGTYTQSYGLETYIQKDLIRDSNDMFEYIKSSAETNFLYTDLLSAYLSYKCASKNNLDEILKIEEIIEVSRIPKEIRLASEKLGSRFIKTVSSLDVKYESEIFNKYSSRKLGGNRIHSVAYGVFCSSCNIDINKAMERYLYAYISAAVINAVKLIPLSQTNGQKILYSCYGFLEEIINKLPKLTIEDLCLSTPGFDIRCMQHERLYSRLYMS
ncbi:urease accessory protein UreF [Clostridium butyricum]|uniref:Urease accessory protein UreF n=1 Tax=human gut metagenome TaxID=408170 RepID=W1WPX7_9ZZZZ|nr:MULTISPECIES: urease accessory protein UreF [Clostridium]KJZ86138.1 Urease accessory protein UreF [Clostridium sp. IBUN125C]KJZ90438.1 Urease accessory protein UreF [Clostridium sp. IBUN62F]KJZ96636.1 Urease accessory protein UreF [Clostridium sp. IBUN22A]MBS4840941.1 urease accessory protein UreF [Clostridium sp.]ALP91402.1 urease accessory protein [Clostridium butyricum]